MAKKTKKANKTNTSKTKSKRKNNKKKQQSFLGFAFKWLFVVGFWCTLFVVAICAYYATELPDITEKASFERKSSIIVKASNGTIIGRYGDLVGEKVTIETVPEDLVNAVLATEDRRFYYHPGMDPVGITRAMLVNAKEKRFAQGGSTITQQLAKNLFLSRERTIKRKIQELMLAFWLEFELSKDEILEAYLNRVYLGGGTYGVDAASQLYFKKPVSDITLNEAATLAGLLKAPSTYSPIANPVRSRERTAVVLNAMLNAGYISEEEKNQINAAIPKPPRKPSGNAQRYYSDWIVDQTNKLLGPTGDDLIIETTMNIDIQKTAEETLKTTLMKDGGKQNITQGAIVTMRPNGAVVALVGGKDYGVSQFNRATQAARQPGSSFKPMTYIAALENGWSASDLIMDEPITKGRYRPKNFGHKYYGEVTLLEALTLSLNTVAYHLIKDVGPDAVIDIARRLGIESELNADLSLALGTNQISPIELTGAYASLANGGVMVKPYGITKITSKDGTVYYERKNETRGRRAISPRTIAMIMPMMQSVIQNGTGQGANFGNTMAAGKTGTSQDSRDAWFIGFTNRLVTGVWLGNDDNSSMKRVTGGSQPARIWRSVMSKHNGQYAPFRYEIPFFERFEDLLAQWTGGFGFNGRNPAGGDEILLNSNNRRTHHDQRQQDHNGDILPERGRYND
ncbi:MAG: transglycosylase domain-containing protein [Bdellovibrionales bacterium]